MRQLVFVLAMLTLSYVYAQENNACVVVKGVVKSDQLSIDSVKISVLKNGVIDTLVFTDLRGKFELSLKEFSRYKISLAKPGFYNQHILFNTQHDLLTEGCWIYRFEAELLPVIDDMDNDLFDQPMGSIAYNINKDEFDNILTKSQRENIKILLDIHDQKRLITYQELISKADEAFNGKQYAASKRLYQKAINYDFYSDYADIQLAMIERIVNQEIRIENKYHNHIDLADEYYQLSDYKKAKKHYNKALLFKQEDYPLEQLQTIKKIVSVKEVIASSR